VNNDNDDRHQGFHPLTPTRRPTHVLIQIEIGQGHDPAALARAWKKMRNARSDSGL
jgi:hypothetical protein